MESVLAYAVEQVLAGKQLSEEEALALALLPKQHNLDLFAAASIVRAKYARPGVHTCAIVNAKSGRCPENCAFCAQSAHHHTSAPVYDLLSREELLRSVEEAEKYGVQRFGIVTSGTTLSAKDLDTLCEDIAFLRQHSAMAFCGSLGLLDANKAQCLREAGLTSYHHNLETARSFFANICTTHAYERDLETLRIAKEANLRVCSCGIFGLGESWAQRIELLQCLRDAHVDSLPINFLNPIPGTRLAQQKLLEPSEALRVLAIARLMHPSKDIIVCGGRLATLGAENAWVLAAGASGIMTGNYLTTKGCGLEDDAALLRYLGVQD